MNFGAPAGGILKHAAKQAADFRALDQEGLMLLSVYVMTGKSGVEPVLGFGVFAVGVGELGYEMGLVASFSPGFRNVGPNGTGGTAALIREGEHFLLGKCLGNLEQRLLQGESFFVGDQIAVISDVHEHGLLLVGLPKVYRKLGELPIETERKNETANGQPRTAH